MWLCDRAFIKNVFTFLGIFTKLQKLTVSFVMSVWPSVSVQPDGTTQLPPDEFSVNLIFEDI
jgi:hypothetical protein